MSAPAYMLSLLQRQRQLLGTRFAQRYPSHWLVWEPGQWRPARSVESSNTESTQMPGRALDLRPEGADALCFELKGVPPTLTLGRGSDNHIVINDLTVSREQLQLAFAEGKWRLACTTTTRLDGRPLDGREAGLRDGARIEVGDVELTFYSSAGLEARLEAMEKKQPAPRPSAPALHR